MDTTKKKILYIITKSNYGGAQRYVHELAVAMQKKGYAVTVATGGTGPLVEKLKAVGVETREIESYQRDLNIFKEWTSLGELWRLYRKERPDIVHLNSSKAGVTGGFIARFAGVPCIIFTVHGWPFLEPRGIIWRIGTWIGMYLATLFAHKVIPISEYDRAHAHMPFTQNTFTEVIYNGISEEENTFKKKHAARISLVGEEMSDRHARDLWLISSAELHPKKNLASAIAAVSAFNRKSPRKAFYLIMGSGVLKEQLTRCITQHNAKDSVLLLGYVENARAYVTAGDVFMLPSKQEGLPYALLEAGIAGLPIIAGNVCGIPELIEDERTGLLIDPFTPDTITAAIAKLAESPTLCTNLGTALREKVREDFSFRSMVTKTEDVYSVHKMHT